MEKSFKEKLLNIGKDIDKGIDKSVKNIGKITEKALKSKITSRKILKKSKTSYKMPYRQVSNIFEDENRFFKGAIQNGML